MRFALSPPCAAGLLQQAGMAAADTRRRHIGHNASGHDPAQMPHARYTIFEKGLILFFCGMQGADAGSPLLLAMKTLLSWGFCAKIVYGGITTRLKRKACKRIKYSGSIL